jgi:hypothetical protein
MRRLIALFFTVLAAPALAPSAAAQSLAAVPHPDVKAGERVFDYRAGYALGDDGRSSRFGQRYHFMVALDDRIRLRVVVQHGERADGVVATQTVSPQAQFQLVESERSGGWDSAIRLDGFIPIDGRPGRARVGVFNAIDLGGGVEARGNLFLARDFGERAVAGVQIETRAELSFAAAARTRVGVQLFDALNSTARFGSFDEQRHQLGVFARAKPGKRLGVEAGWLFGLSGAAPDADVRLILTYSL